MRVMGMAEKNPAAAIWEMVKGVGSDVWGEKRRTRDLPTS